MANKCPAALELWTADEAAECLSYRKHLPDDYPGGWQALDRKLWGFLEAADNPTPLGGDGTEGTVEYPDGRWSPENDDKAPHWWGKLNEVEQAALMAAFEEDYR